jgi:hypothetical protein
VAGSAVGQHQQAKLLERLFFLIVEDTVARSVLLLVFCGLVLFCIVPITKSFSCYTVKSLE